MQKDVIYNVCSNPDCKYSEGFKRNTAWRPGSCPFCGADILYACPACGEELRYKNQHNCTDSKCRSEIKPAPRPKKKAQPREQ